MELYKALKTVIDLQGPEILKDQRLINTLGDFKAYEEAPAAKFLLKSIINEGLITKILIAYQDKINNELKDKEENSIADDDL